MEKIIIENCPHGHGLMRSWDGELRCWKCGFTNHTKVLNHQIATDDDSQVDSETNNQFAKHESTDKYASGGLFSDGYFGLLEKGPIGWILFGFIGGVLYGIYNAIREWLNI